MEKISNGINLGNDLLKEIKEKKLFNSNSKIDEKIDLIKSINVNGISKAQKTDFNKKANDPLNLVNDELVLDIFKNTYEKKINDSKNTHELVLETKEFDTTGIHDIEVKNVLKGIDVSVYQNEIDWEQVEKNIDLAILKIGGSDDDYYIDSYFSRNIEECKKRNIPVGIYYFSTATTKEEANKEAQSILDNIKDYDLECPIYFDVELDDLRYYWASNPDEFKETYGEALQTIADAGYCPGIYSYSNILDNVKDDLDCAFWTLSHETYDIPVDVSNFDESYIYTGNELSKDYQSYQYCEVGTIDGIETNVDVDYFNSGLLDYIKEHSNK